MKIALVGRDAKRVLAFRGSLIRLCRERGHEVIAITGPATAAEIDTLQAAGVQWAEACVNGGGVNPLPDLRYQWDLRRLFRVSRVDAVLAYNPKCLAFGTVAARDAGVASVVGMVTGLGHGFIGRGLQERLVRLAKSRLYRRAFAACDRILVQNDHDLVALKRCGALQPEHQDRVIRIAGSGVDLDAFAPVPQPDGVRFLMISRPLREKGLPEFFEAAARVKAAHPAATFAWLGSMEDANPSAIGRATLEQLLADGTVEHLPECPDVRPAIAACNVLVLPSHREGTSKVMLEAMAMGRPVITTDAPGCGHLTANDTAGRVVPVGDARALAQAIAWCATQPAWRQQAGVHARLEVERSYDARIVDRKILGALLDKR